MLKKSLFIVFEGIDGSGKSTQADLLFDYLKSMQISAVKLAEPSHSKWGMKIRKMLKGEIVPPANKQLELFIHDREDDVATNILPALKKKQIIVMDRYYYSNAAYQGAGGLSSDYILNENKKRNFPEPDRIYFIDILPDDAIKRISKRNDGQGSEIFEKKNFLQKVREIYLSIADEKFLIIDGSLDIDTIFNIVKEDFRNNFMSDLCCKQ